MTLKHGQKLGDFSGHVWALRASSSASSMEYIFKIGQKHFNGLVLWLGGKHCHLQDQRLMWALVVVPAAQLPIQLPVNAPGKIAEDGSSL